MIASKWGKKWCIITIYILLTPTIVENKGLTASVEEAANAGKF